MQEREAFTSFQEPAAYKRDCESSSLSFSILGISLNVI